MLTLRRSAYHPGLPNQASARKRDALYMDVTVEPLLSQVLHRPDQPFHGVVGTAHDSRTQKEALDVIAPVEVDGQRDDLAGCKGRPGNIVSEPIDAIGAVEDTHVGVKNLQQRDATAVFSVGVADTGGRGITQTTTRIFSPTAAGRTGYIVFGGIGQYGQFVFDAHQFARPRSRASISRSIRLDVEVNRARSE